MDVAVCGQGVSVRAKPSTDSDWIHWYSSSDVVEFEYSHLSIMMSG